MPGKARVNTGAAANHFLSSLQAAASPAHQRQRSICRQPESSPPQGWAGKEAEGRPVQGGAERSGRGER
eukprot:2536449-Alexandrium_andersonii.AAC.1